MTAFRLLASADHRLDEIYAYTQEHWGETQAERYLSSLFDRFAGIAERAFPWKSIPAEFGVDGYVCRCQHHFIYWKLMEDGSVGIVTVLHESMHQMERFKEAFPD